MSERKWKVIDFWPKKSLGQHWLEDEASLKYIAGAVDITERDVILEIGPGFGELTKYLLAKAKKVVAVEKDERLADSLQTRLKNPKLLVVKGDILQFNFDKLPAGYKAVANIPYYLTSNLLRRLVTAKNPPAEAALLLQKEVAQRVCAGPGNMSVLSVSVQLQFEPKLGRVIPAEAFNPPPKVDSQLVILKRRAKPLFRDLDDKKFFKLVKAGFSAKRKKLRSSLSGGLGISKEKAEELLNAADINPNLRAENLSLQQWHQLYTQQQLKSDLRSLL